MRIVIETVVDQDLETVIKGFNEELFLKLNPPFPPVKLLQFDGCLKGDVVELELNFLLFKQIWRSDITEDHRSAGVFYFVDEGVKLPFFLKSWRHKHHLKVLKQGTMILDDITFQAPNKLLTLLMYPLLYIQFLYRKPIYKRIFKKTGKIISMQGKNSVLS